MRQTRFVPWGMFICLLFLLSCDRNQDKVPSQLSDDHVSTITVKLKEFEQSVRDAKDASEEAVAIRSMSDWVRSEQAKLTTPERGPGFAWWMRVTEKATGKNVTSDVDGSQGDILVEIIFAHERAGQFQNIYTLTFTPKDKANLEPLFME